MKPSFFKKKKFIYLFILLYNVWFCHTLTWIRHECTYVPHPDPPPTSLPIPALWIIPVHQPQAPCILHQTWTGDSFLIWYYTCFNTILPNHPTLSLSLIHTHTHVSLSIYIYYLYMNVHGSFLICSSQNLETTQTSISRWTGKQIFVHLYHRLLLNNKKKWTTDTHIQTKIDVSFIKFKAVLFLIAKAWKQPTHPSTVNG